MRLSCITNSKTVNNHFIISVCASWVKRFISLGHGSVQFVTNLYPTVVSATKMRQKVGFSLKKSVHGSSKFSGCGFDKTSFVARSESSFLLISLWLGIQQNVIYLLPDNISWHVCKTLFTRGFLLSWLSMACYTDMQSENITNIFLKETFTYVKALLIASTSAVKILRPSLSL